MQETPELAAPATARRTRRGMAAAAEQPAEAGAGDAAAQAAQPAAEEAAQDAGAQVSPVQATAAPRRRAATVRKQPRSGTVSEPLLAQPPATARRTRATCAAAEPSAVSAPAVVSPVHVGSSGKPGEAPAHEAAQDVAAEASPDQAPAARRTTATAQKQPRPARVSEPLLAQPAAMTQRMRATRAAAEPSAVSAPAMVGTVHAPAPAEPDQAVAKEAHQVRGAVQPEAAPAEDARREPAPSPVMQGPQEPSGDTARPDQATPGLAAPAAAQINPLFSPGDGNAGSSQAAAQPSATKKQPRRSSRRATAHDEEATALAAAFAPHDHAETAELPVPASSQQAVTAAAAAGDAQEPDLAGARSGNKDAEAEDDIEVDFEDAQDAFDTPASRRGEGTPATAFASARQQQTGTAYKTGRERMPGV